MKTKTTTRRNCPWLSQPCLPPSVILSEANGSLSFPRPVRFHPSAFITHAFLAGWLVATNLNNILKKTIIKLAAEVAGLIFCKDEIVLF